MKSLHCVYNKDRFADQYTIDLEGFMNPHEFTATINTFNTAAWNCPPPARITGVTQFYLVFASTIMITTIFVVIHQTNQMGLTLFFPFLFLTACLTFIYYRRRQRSRFESAMIHLCSCMNATENVRGINFRLTYLTPEQQISVNPSSTYAITIEFDDRYNLLHHFSPAYNMNASPPTYNTLSPPSYDIDGLKKPNSVYNPNEKIALNV